MESCQPIKRLKEEEEKKEEEEEKKKKDKKKIAFFNITVGT
jgi:hypothetical protein